jgi:hypothetical protein
MNRAPHHVARMGVGMPRVDRPSNRIEADDDARILMSTSRFRAHDADNARGCLGASARYASALDVEESERES